MLKKAGALTKQAELKSLEVEYRYLVKNCPTSFNATREWHKTVQKCVTRMRVLRNIKREHGSAWLQEIISREVSQ